MGEKCCRNQNNNQQQEEEGVTLDSLLQKFHWHKTFTAAGVSLTYNFNCCRGFIDIKPLLLQGFIARKQQASLLQGFHCQKTAGFTAAEVSLPENSRLHCCRGFIARKQQASLLQGFHRQKTAGFTAVGVSLAENSRRHCCRGFIDRKQQASLLQGFHWQKTAGVTAAGFHWQKNSRLHCWRGFIGRKQQASLLQGVSLTENSRLHRCRGFIGRKQQASLLQGFYWQKTAGFTAVGVSLTGNKTWDYYLCSCMGIRDTLILNSWKYLFGF